MKYIKYILGLDIGSNSIGWALIQLDLLQKTKRIIATGSRIIPMDQKVLSDFGKGITISPTAQRTSYRNARHCRERHLLRRERLHRVLHILGFLPTHYDKQIDFSKRYGKFVDNTEPKIAYNERKFLFMDSFQEMLADFKIHQPDLFYTKKNGEESKIPYDWTIYYLRKKALSRKISKEELAWIILNFNQKRGYYQLREEEEENKENDFEIISSKIISVIKKDKDKKYNKYWYDIILENGLVYQAAFYNDFVYNWINQDREFIIERISLKNGTEKVKLSYLPTFDEIDKMDKKEQDKYYKKIKIKTENSIGNKTVGCYIYDHILQNPNEKIKGKLVRTIERKYYKEELKAILEKQVALQPELFTDQLFADCIRELYSKNEAQQRNLAARDFVHLFVEDIIFYQRSLRRQKSTLANCSLESRSYIDKDSHTRKEAPLKVCPKSNPYYQEFRVLQWLQNLKIYEIDTDQEVTHEFIKTLEDKQQFFDFLMNQKEIDCEELLKYFLNQTYPNAREKALKSELKKWKDTYRWNYVYDIGEKSSKKYPMNETRYELKRHLEKVANLPDDFLSSEVEYLLWHLIYSVKDKVAYEKGLKTFAQKHHLDKDSFVESFKKFKPYPSEYGSFSEKAIRKLLPLMRFGSYWDFNHIDKNTQKRIEDLITGVENEEIRTILREKAEKYQLEKETDFQDLPLWLAQYIVYNRHAEASSLEKWTSVNDLETYLNEFKQYSLRNPIVEQVVMETLRVVRDIWQQYGQGQASFFDEIHIELGRELKKTAKEREKLSKQNQKNEDINLSIKEKLKELEKYNTRAYSITHQEKYKLWLEQKHISPYTGQIISPENLFTDNYEIEHIIPQSRFFDDSLSNKVVCESIVNKAPYKDRQLGLEFIKNQGGRIVKELSTENKTIKIFTEEQYRTFIKEHYSNNPEKTKKLLLEEIPEKMVARQMNDTCYISKFISEILSKIVRSDEQDEGVHSKNVILCTGKITSALKQDWGVNDVWNDLILPRFERMNDLTQSTLFTTYNEKYQKYLPTVPMEYSNGFQKKRIDHRHHAMDAIIIACATREHINYINNQHALEKGKDKKEKQKEHDKLREKLCIKKDNKGSEENYSWIFKKPWDTFTQEVQAALEGIVVSFKQNLRVINKATNYYERWVEENGKYIKKMVKQEGTNWAIRKPLHEETISGKIYLDREEITKNDILTATRKTVDSSFDEKRIKKITDTGIQKILLNYLKYKGSPEIAFSPEGLEELNKNLSIYNDGKPHKPIYKVRIYEKGSGRFALGEKGRKYKKYVQGAPNLYFGIYQGANKRSFATIPLNEVIERQKQGRPSIPEYNEKGDPLLFSLSPNDLVYVPVEGEIIEDIDFQNLSKEQKERIYNVNDFSSTCYFTPNRIAKAIFPKEVDLQRKGDKLPGSYDTKTASLEGIQIKEVCIKLKIDRLGNISKA
ncbi:MULTISPECIES: type II CRISPR RNA-guided endonuclease Cas9 [Capnocytophaga]|uniref:type II CRISPR RNA-guided endonuclease Cas9 n=1 Tax=Capnocytophaga TaxID=1016 RepID=UPI00027C69A9|nr:MULTISPECIES: type II CRISPR RNA-guided endonuclease Cas9 [Capnocytophaga]EJU32481.1 CRISPR-associated protein Cas9/Csn1, subtype II/NMEMI [Capnocytophaga sp. CM59]